MLTCGNALVLALSSCSSAVQIPAVYFWFRMFSYTVTRFQSTPRLRILGAYKVHRSLTLQTQQIVMILAVYSSNFRKNRSSSTNTLTTNRFTGSHRCHGSTRRRFFRLLQQVTTSDGVTLLFSFFSILYFSHRALYNTAHVLFQSSVLVTNWFTCGTSKDSLS